MSNLLDKILNDVKDAELKSKIVSFFDTINDYDDYIETDTFIYVKNRNNKFIAGYTSKNTINIQINFLNLKDIYIYRFIDNDSFSISHITNEIVSDEILNDNIYDIDYDFEDLDFFVDDVCLEYGLVRSRK